MYLCLSQLPWHLVCIWTHQARRLRRKAGARWLGFARLDGEGIDWAGSRSRTQMHTEVVKPGGD